MDKNELATVWFLQSESENNNIVNNEVKQHRVGLAFGMVVVGDTRVPL
jgi:class 3 adenylate cyclase